MATTDDMKSIAETIRKAQYGKDVREAIAKGFEQFETVEDDNAALNARVDKLSNKIETLEQIIYGKNPQEVKTANSSTPPLANSGAMLINLTSKEDR